MTRRLLDTLVAILVALPLAVLVAGPAFAQSLGTDGASWTIDMRADDATNTLTFGAFGDSLLMSADDTFTFDRDDAGTITVNFTDNNEATAVVFGDATDTFSFLGALTITTIALENGESINTSTDDVFDFTRDDAGVVTLTSSDNDATAAMTIDPGGSAALTLGSAGDTVTVAATTGLALSNGETVSNGTDGTITLKRNDSGTLSIKGEDNDADAALVISGGNSTIVVGEATTDSITLTTDGTGTGEVVMPDNAVSALEIADDACTNVVSVALNPTEAGATNDFVSLSTKDILTGNASFGTTETAQDQYVVPVGMVATKLRVDVDVAPGAGNDDWKVFLRDDAASTALTVSIDETAVTATDSTNAPAIVAGSKLDILVDSSGGGADPTAAGELIVSFCLSPAS